LAGYENIQLEGMKKQEPSASRNCPVWTCKWGIRSTKRNFTCQKANGWNWNQQKYQAMERALWQLRQLKLCGDDRFEVLATSVAAVEMAADRKSFV
jgi:hypothetical protein